MYNLVETNNIQEFSANAGSVGVSRYEQVNQEIKHLKKQNKSLKTQTEQYWQNCNNLNLIMQNEQMRYNYISYKQQSILGDINKPSRPIGLYRFKNRFYYRPSIYSEVIECDIEQLQEEIGSRYSNINIKVVSDLNDVMYYNNMDTTIDTTYLAINSIPVVDDEVFEKNILDEVFINNKGLYSRNNLQHTVYLANRL